MRHELAISSLQSLLSTPLGGVLIRVGGVVFVVESLIMFALMEVAPKNHAWFILDAPILTVVVALIVNYWIVKPQGRKLSLAMRQLSDAKQEAETLATTDPLTGILNRRAFFSRFERELEDARRTNSPLSYLMLDVDFFKKVNDTFGHLAADAVLRNVSAAMQTTVKGRGLIGRYGGEEFCIMLANTSMADALRFAEGIRRVVADTVVEDDGRPIRVTVSIGVAQSASAIIEADALIRHADSALLNAKAAGRNCVRGATTVEQPYLGEFTVAHSAIGVC